MQAQLMAGNVGKAQTGVSRDRTRGGESDPYQIEGYKKLYMNFIHLKTVYTYLRNSNTVSRRKKVRNLAEGTKFKLCSDVDRVRTCASAGNSQSVVT